MLLRKQVEFAREQQAAELTLRQQQAQRAAAQQQWERGIRERELADQESPQRRQDLINGIVPAHDETMLQPTRTPITPWQPRASPVRAALMKGMTAAQLPVETTPSAPTPVASSATVYTPQTTRVPESYHVTRGAAYQRGMITRELMNEGWVDRETARGQIKAQNDAAHDQRVGNMKAAATAGAQTIARIRTAATGAKSTSPIRSATMKTQEERGREAVADDIIGNAEGSYDEASSFLAGDRPEAQQARDAGVTNLHLMQAHARYTQQTTSQAVRLQTGPGGMDPGEAVDAVTQARRTAGRVKLQRRDDFTDDELVGAYNAGKRTDDEIRAFRSHR